MRLLSEARRREASTSRRVIVPLDVAPLVAAPTQAQVLSLGGETMGTTWSVKFVLPSHVTAGSIKADIEAILDGVIAQMSPWVEDSDISRYNCAPANSWRMIPDDFCAVLKCALKVAQLSDGAYDPAIGALVDLWGFGPTSRPGRIPLQEEIAATRESCGWRSVRLDDMSRALQPGGVRLDLSSIAKGFAVDKVSAWLCARGVIHHLVDIGGELMGQGLKPDGCPWWVALESFRPDLAKADRVCRKLLSRYTALRLRRRATLFAFLNMTGHACPTQSIRAPAGPLRIHLPRRRCFTAPACRRMHWRQPCLCLGRTREWLLLSDTTSLRVSSCGWTRNMTNG